MKILNPRQLAAWVALLSVIMIFNTVSAESAPVVTTAGIIKNASPALTHFIKNSLTDHSNLLAAKADVMSASAALRASDQAVYNPELEFDYEDTDITTKSIAISQTIDWGDQQGRRTVLAKAELHKVKAQYKMAIQSFIRNLLMGLAENQTKKELAQLSHETLKLMQEFRQIAERRYQAGDLNRVELNLARLAYNQALMEQANALSNATEASEKLRATLGTLPSSLPVLPERLPEPVLKNDLEVFLQQLPVIRSQLAEVQVARQELALRKSETAWDPTISVSAGSEGKEDLIGFNLSIPLNIRNNFSAEVDVAHQNLIAHEQRAQLAYRDTRATLIVATDRYRNLLKAWNSWREQSRISVDQQLTLIKQLWQAGDISAADYLLQLKQALETQATGLELRNQLWQVAFDWMSLTASIDSWLNIDTSSTLLEKN